MIKHIIITIILSISSFALLAQDAVADELKALADNQQYEEIITRYGLSKKAYSAKSLYYVGLAYYMKEDDNNCLKFMNLSIDKDPTDAKAYYFKASTLNYLDQYEEAVPVFKKAIELKATVPDYYSGLGDSYYNLKKPELALEAYKKATEQEEVLDRPYAMIGQIYSELKNNEKALEAYYVAKTKISKETKSYVNALYNIGLFESLKGNYDMAEPAFMELLELAPTDYHAMAKLIQIYYHQKNYEKAKPYKEKLYDAYRNGKLEGNLKDMFCFDQFKWNDKHVQAYERYQTESKDIYNKHIFYILGTDGEIEFKIQTEYSPISVELKGPKYLLCMTKGDKHSTFNIGFNDDLKYDDLKASVIKVLEEKVKPSATSQPGK